MADFLVYFSRDGVRWDLHDKSDDYWHAARMARSSSEGVAGRDKLWRVERPDLPRPVIVTFKDGVATKQEAKQI